MSEDVNKKKKSRMQRIVTGTALAAALLTVLAIGGWVMALTVAVCLLLAVYEEHKALKLGGHRPAEWPSYAALIAAIPLMLTYSAVAIGPVLLVFSLASILCVMVREKPELTDILMSLMPLFTLVLPGILLYGILATEPRALQLYLLLLTFVIPILGDTFAYFVGSSVGGPKLCPAISPNKTISCASGGLAGSVVFTVAAGLLYPINGLLLNPMIGGFAMSLSSVFVVGNALRLRTKKL